MVAAANLVEVAALVGDTARATMLNALMGGQWLTATELAYCANVSRSTASGHLSKLVAARLLTVTRKRRFSYYRIASPLVATMLESMKVVAAIEVPPRHRPRSANDDALRLPEVATITWLARSESPLPMHLWPWGTSCSPMKAVRSRLRAGVSFPRSALISPADSADFLPALSRLERASLSPQGARRRSHSGSTIGARLAQMCVGQPCAPTNVVWKGGLVRNLPDRDQQRGRANRSIMRPTTADSLKHDPEKWIPVFG